MSHKTDIHRFVDPSEQSLIEAAGYGGGNDSEDGLLRVVCKGDCDMTIGDLSIPPKPEYLNGELPNWPFASTIEAAKAIGFQASGQNASDGWIFNGLREGDS